ncbi:MAG: hypothetical protein ACOX75_02305 [Lachnospiraceae bacterium]|jgi:hypothetical protein
MRRRRRSTYNIYARKNWLARNKVLIICVCAVVAVAFTAAVILFLVFQKQESEEIQYENMSAASLPTLTMEYKERQINLLHGYIQPLDAGYVRRNIYILEDTYDIPIRVELYGNTIQSVTYKVMDTARGNLVQNSVCEDLGKDGTGITGILRIDNLIEDGKEYVLVIVLKDGTDREIYYYSRIKRDSSSFISEQLDYALYFNECLFNAGNDEIKAFVTSNMDTKYWMDINTDFSSVSLYSSVSSVIWGTMNVTLLEEPEVEILDVDGELGYFQFNYMVTRQEGGGKEYYRVYEYYRMRTANKKTYILNYERTTDQIFDPYAEGTIETGAAKLGIMADDVITRMCNPSGTISVFVANETLWAMDTGAKTLRKIFSFSTSVNDKREMYDRHELKIIDVTDEGDIQFIVYGYMNAGLHEGRVGISMYTYRAESEEAVEEIFIPTNLPYEILKESIGNLFYLSDTNNLYIMMDQYLYRMNLDTNRAELVMGGLKEGTFVIHTSGNLIAWQADGKINDADKITVLNLESGESYEVRADSGHSIKALGFLNQEFVYGQGKTGELYEEQSGKEYLLMTDMYVVDGQKISNQTDSGEGFFVEAINEHNRVVLKRVAKKAEGFDFTDDYTIFATDIEARKTLSYYSAFEEIKRTVYYVRFADETTTGGNLIINKKAQVLFTDANTVDIRDMFDDSGKYYVYAKGDVKSIEEDAGAAIMLAYSQYGMVIEPDGTVFYKRGVIPREVALSNVTIELALEKIKAGDMVNVTGITLVEAMYYTGSKIAFVWERDGQMYLFTGYDFADNITMKNVYTGEETEMASDDITEMFSTTGHTYVVK